MYKRISRDDRIVIEKMLKNNYPVSEIAKVIGKSRVALYAEIKKGLVIQLDSELIKYKAYSAVKAQQITDYNMTGKGICLKIGNNHEAVKELESLLLKGYSPYAASQMLKRTHNVSLSKNTVYSYIYKGIFLNVTTQNMIIGRRKPKRDKVERKHKRLYGKSIEDRPQEINNRETFGHWEMDTVVSKKDCKTVLLVLTERYSRFEHIIKIKEKTAIETVKALKRIKKTYGNEFNTIFKTITCDNGSEFSQAEAIEKLGVKLYFAHPYSAFERGSNENQNRIIRRKYPKGTDFGKVSETDIEKLQDWINEYPRKLHNGYSAKEVYEAIIK